MESSSNHHSQGGPEALDDEFWNSLLADFNVPVRTAPATVPEPPPLIHTVSKWSFPSINTANAIAAAYKKYEKRIIDEWITINAELQPTKDRRNRVLDQRWAQLLIARRLIGRLSFLCIHSKL